MKKDKGYNTKRILSPSLYAPFYLLFLHREDNDPGETERQAMNFPKEGV